MQKSEQEIASLQASLARSETQVIRYKSTAEAAEKAETDLKVERRKLQREVGFLSHISKNYIEIEQHFDFFSPKLLSNFGTNVTANKSFKNGVFEVCDFCFVNFSIPRCKCFELLK